MVPWKHLSNFWRTRGMSLINGEINIILTWSQKSILSFNTAANQPTTFTTTYRKLYVSLVTLSAQYNAKLLQQLRSGFKRTIIY